MKIARSSRRYWWIVLVLAAAALIALGAAGWHVYSQRSIPVAKIKAVPTPVAAEDEEVPPLLFQPLTEQEALQINAAMPFTTMPNPAATPFILPKDDLVTYTAALDCMTAAIYYEAGYESAEGRAAVAQVILNRVRHPLFPKSVCGVVFQGSDRVTGCQFSFTCDGSILRIPNQQIYAQAREIAEAALAGHVEATVGWSTHYHANYVVPYWGPKLAKTAVIDTHIFYRFAAPMGLARAYTGTYDKAEPVIALMAGLTTPVTTDVPVTTAIDDATAAAIKPGPVQLDVAPLPIDLPPPTITLPEAKGDAPASAPTTTPSATPTPPANPYFPTPARRARGRLPM